MTKGIFMPEFLNQAAYLLDAIPRMVFRAFFPEKPKEADYIWAKYDPLFPPVVRLVDGTWAGEGVLWRRRRPDGQWEYRQDPETVEDWSFRQW